MKQVLCEKCRKHPATVYYKENVNGKEKEMHLCRDCAQKEGVGQWLEQPMFSGNVFAPFSLFSDTVFGALPKRQSAVCPTCHTSAENIRESGKFGCPSCYDVFRDFFDFTPFVGAGYAARRLSDEPCGQDPEVKQEAKETPAKKEEPSVEAKIEERRRQLKEAIREENYERCAVLRDEIRALEGK